MAWLASVYGLIVGYISATFGLHPLAFLLLLAAALWVFAKWAKGRAS